MLSLLTVTRTLSTTRLVRGVPLEKAVERLQDPPTLIKLNPFVTNFTESDPGIYDVTERVPVLGYFHFTTRFTAKFTNVEEGVDTQVRASLGTALLSQYRAKELPEGGVELSVKDTIACIFLFMPLVANRVATRQSHQFDKLIAILENRPSGDNEHSSE